MDILLFTKFRRKGEYFSLKLKSAGHTVSIAETLSSVHTSLRFSDPDFVIVDSDTFPDPDTDYRRIITICRRKFLLFYDRELKDTNVQHEAACLTSAQKECLFQIADVLNDLQIYKTLEKISCKKGSEEERLLLKANRLRPPLALLLAYLLKNRDTDIMMEDLLHLLWSDSRTSHQQTLYAYMNQLRMLLESRNIPLIIEKRLKGTYCIRSRQ